MHFTWKRNGLTPKVHRREAKPWQMDSSDTSRQWSSSSEQVEGAMQRQHLHASDWTVYYLVNLLASFVSPAQRRCQMAATRAARDSAGAGPGRRGRSHARRPSPDRRRLAVSRRVLRRQPAAPAGRPRLLHHPRRLRVLACWPRDDDAFADVFGELAEKFVPVVDVLSDISDRSRSSNRDVLRLYERWLRTGSERDRNLLARKGLDGAGVAPDPVGSASRSGHVRTTRATCVMIPASGSCGCPATVRGRFRLPVTVLCS